MSVDAATIAALVPNPYVGPAWRHTSPRWNPLSGEGARIHGGRFNPPDSFPVLYLCLSRECAVAEFLRMADRHAIGPTGFLPWRVHELAVDLERVLDLSDPGVREVLQLPEDALTDDDLAVTREIGVVAHGLSMQGVRSPSATHAGDVLAAFPENLGRGTMLVERSHVWESLDQLQVE